MPFTPRKPQPHNALPRRQQREREPSSSLRTIVKNEPTRERQLPSTRPAAVAETADTVKAATRLVVLLCTLQVTRFGGSSQSGVCLAHKSNSRDEGVGEGKYIGRQKKKEGDVDEVERLAAVVCQLHGVSCSGGCTAV